jgi:predicted Na+-dependent transporter
VEETMKIFKKIDQYFWIFLSSAIILGLFSPQTFLPFEGYVIYIVMAIVGLLFLKVDMIDVVTHIKQPFFLLYVAIINLLVTPLFIYFIFKYISPELTPGLVLLAALPSGVTSAAFTDMMKGRTSLTLTIIILTNLLSIVTIPFIFYLLFDASLDINSVELGLNILKVFGIPFFIAKVIKRILFPGITLKLQDYFNIIIVTLLSIIIAISISFTSEQLLSDLKTSTATLGYLFLVFFIFQLIGYFSVFWHKKGEKIAISNSNMIMNNILGIVLALAFFNEEILNLVVLSIIPWSTMIVAKHWYKRLLP